MVVFPAGETMAFFEVMTNTDSDQTEGLETFFAQLSEPVNALLGLETGATATIQDRKSVCYV